MKKQLLAVLLTVCLILGMMPSAVAAPGTGFYRVSGRKILDENGRSVVIKSITFSNATYGNPPDISVGVYLDHDAQSFFEVKEMGLDYVRFEFNYGLFEDDDKPYVYKQAGFDWLDQNIEWAKAAGVKLILQMKTAQGGYQQATSLFDENDVMNSGGKFLWLGKNAESNQARLVALWRAIAERYRDEPSIIGYGLINEPVPPQQETAEETVGVWKNLAQRIAYAIREVDDNHMLFVPEICAWFNAEDYNSTNWNLVPDYEKLFTIDDSNTVYEFQFALPMEFTHQGADWMDGYEDLVTYYPYTTYDSSDWSSKGTVTAAATGTAEDGWLYFETEPFSLDPGSYNVVKLQFSGANLPAGGRVWFDDVTVTRTDANGTEKIYTNGFTGTWQEMGKIWSASGLVTADIDPNVGHSGKGALCLTNSDSSPSGPWDNAELYNAIVMEDGCSYQLGGWVKGSDTNGLTANFQYWAPVPMDKSWLEKQLLIRLSFGEANHVPMVVASWNFTADCYGRGADKYTKDLTELYTKYDLGTTFFSYHDALYNIGLWDERGERYELLYMMLMNYYTKVPVNDPEIVELPASLTHIDANAFENDGAIRVVVIPDGTQSIGSRAFAHCDRLRRIHIPESVTDISGDAFKGAEQVLIVTTEGSFAQQFAQENKLDCFIENLE